MTRLIISDIRGTITDLETQAVEFYEAYLGRLAELLESPVAEIREDMDELMTRMNREPDQWGWVVEGETVAPAMVDPFVRTRVAAEQLIQNQDRLNGAALQDWLDRAFRESARVMRTIFKNDAIRYLTLLERAGGSFMVNAAAEEMEALFDELADHVVSPDGAPLLVDAFGQATADEVDLAVGIVQVMRGRIRGEAGKNVPGVILGRMPERLEIPGLKRGVLLQRSEYYRALDELRRANGGASWSDLWVVGDIFELDLAMPWALGANVVMVDNGVMPDYECRFLEGRERVHVTETLTGACEILFG